MVVDEQLDQWQSTASELKCGRLCMLADWSLALQSGPTPSASVPRYAQRPCSPVAPWPSHLDSASVASAQRLDHDLCPQAGHSMITSTVERWDCAIFAIIGFGTQSYLTEHGPCDVIDMICKCSKAP